MRRTRVHLPEWDQAESDLSSGQGPLYVLHFTEARRRLRMDGLSTDPCLCLAQLSNLHVTVGYSLSVLALGHEYRKKLKFILPTYLKDMKSPFFTSHCSQACSRKHIGMATAKCPHQGHQQRDLRWRITPTPKHLAPFTTYQ